MDKSRAGNKERRWTQLFLFALAVYILKNIFVGADNDEGYGIVVGYRLASGDRLLLDMWEPHQTSAIFTAMLIRPFLWVMGGSMEFLNIYLRIVYFVIHGGISYGLFFTLRCCFPEFQKMEAACLTLVYFACSPKSIYVPEYSNLHIWFFTLLCLGFVWYYCSTSPLYKKRWILFLTGFFLTCDVLAYPTMILLLPFCLILILWKSKLNRFKDCFTFLFPCVICAGLFICYLLTYMTTGQIFHSFMHITEDGSHQLTLLDKLNIYLHDFIHMSITLLINATISFVFMHFCKHISRKKKKQCYSHIYFSICFLFVHIAGMYYAWFTSMYGAFYPRLIYVAIILMGIWCFIKSCKKNYVGLHLIILSVVNYFSVMIASNWEPVFLTSYLIMGCVGGFLCWKTYLSENNFPWKDRVFTACCGILACSCLFGYSFRIIGGDMVPSTLFEIRGINRSGFRKGILVNYMSAYRYNKNAEIWPEIAPAGSKVLYVGPTQFFYLLGDCIISTPNTTSTPTYDESLLVYWEEHPERYPDVIIFESWFGDIRIVAEDSFIMQWVQNEFPATEVTEYPYVTVYKRN